METNFSCPNISGIYKIINKIDGKYYVGSSNNIEMRWLDHKIKLRKNKHANIYLQRSWNKYGEGGFEFVIVEQVPLDNLLITEQKYLDTTKNKRGGCYNISMDAQKPEMNDDTRKKISLSLMGKYKGVESPHFGTHHTEKTKQKMSIIKKGKPSPNKGKSMSIEQKEKIKNSLLKIRVGLDNKKLKKWVFVSPKNEIVNIFNLRKFCRENNLIISHIRLVLNGVRKSHKGWTKSC